MHRRGWFRVHCKRNAIKSSRFDVPLPRPRDRAVPARRHSYTKAASVGVRVKTRGPCGLPFARERYIKLVTLTLRRRSGRGVQTG